MKLIQNFKDFSEISENLNYHIENNIPLVDNIFRPESESYFELLKESRECFEKGLFENLNEIDEYLFKHTDIGIFEDYEGSKVPLDLPLFTEEYLNILEAEYHGKSVELNKPMRSSGPKKYKVYVKNPKTNNVQVIHFGDVKGGLKAKVADPDARKRFAARHNCHLKKDKLTPGYWACRVNRYAHLWGGKSYPGYW
jgi:hypothetical protein